MLMVTGDVLIMLKFTRILGQNFVDFLKKNLVKSLCVVFSNILLRQNWPYFFLFVSLNLQRCA